MNTIELLSSALRTIGANFDVPTLELILKVHEKVIEKGADISLSEIGTISSDIAEKYKLKQENK